MGSGLPRHVPVRAHSSGQVLTLQGKSSSLFRAFTTTPTSWLEFDVEDVAQASEELKARGYTPLIEAKKEPWGQTVTRLLSPEGILVGLTYTPGIRESES